MLTVSQIRKLHKATLRRCIVLDRATVGLVKFMRAGKAVATLQHIGAFKLFRGEAVPGSETFVSTDFALVVDKLKTMV